jgi:hypothetical protein
MTVKLSGVDAFIIESIEKKKISSSAQTEQPTGTTTSPQQNPGSKNSTSPSAPESNSQRAAKEHDSPPSTNDTCE